MKNATKKGEYMKNKNKIIEILSQNKIKYFCDELLSTHTSIKIGGKTPIFVEIASQKQLVDLLVYCDANEIKYHILGNGTNTLFDDSGFNGIVVCTKALKKFKVSNQSLFAECGFGLFELGKITKNLGLSGLEFAYGIPGSVGGAIVMNAGAFGENIGDFVEYVKVYQNGEVKRLSQKQMQFAYRSSLAQTQKMVVLGAKFVLAKSSPKDIETRQQQFFKHRLQTQPYSDLSFGSAFKRNTNFPPVSKLIDELGLKGYHIGGAEISKKHAGFIVNVGSATCQDCILLIQYIQSKIFDAYGFVPEPEVKIVT